MTWALLPHGIAIAVLVGIVAAFACRKCWKRRDYSNERGEL